MYTSGRTHDDALARLKRNRVLDEGGGGTHRRKLKRKRAENERFRRRLLPYSTGLSGGVIDSADALNRIRRIGRDDSNDGNDGDGNNDSVITDALGSRGRNSRALDAFGEYQQSAKLWDGIISNLKNHELQSSARILRRSDLAPPETRHLPNALTFELNRRRKPIYKETNPILYTYLESGSRQERLNYLIDSQRKTLENVAHFNKTGKIKYPDVVDPKRRPVFPGSDEPVTTTPSRASTASNPTASTASATDASGRQRQQRRRLPQIRRDKDYGDREDYDDEDEDEDEDDGRGVVVRDGRRKMSTMSSHRSTLTDFATPVRNVEPREHFSRTIIPKKDSDYDFTNDDLLRTDERAAAARRVADDVSLLLNSTSTTKLTGSSSTVGVRLPDPSTVYPWVSNYQLDERDEGDEGDDTDMDNEQQQWRQSLVKGVKYQTRSLPDRDASVFLCEENKRSFYEEWSGRLEELGRTSNFASDDLYSFRTFLEWLTTGEGGGDS